MRSLFIAAVITAFSSFTSFSQTTDSKAGNFLVKADFNYAYRLGKIEDGGNQQLRTYLKNLKSGYSYDLSAYYMYDTHTGLGLKYNAFKSSGTFGTTFVTAPNGQTGYGELSDDITISYYALSSIFDLLKNSDKHHVNFEASLGYMHYKDDAKILGDYTITGGSFGAELSIDYQYEIFQNFTAGPKVAFLTGGVKKFKIKGPNDYSETQKLEDDKSESLLRLDLGVSASYRF